MKDIIKFERALCQKLFYYTGATDGIGLVTAEKLVTQGHTVLTHGRNAEKLNAAEKKLLVLKTGTVKSYRADLSNFNEVDALATAILMPRASTLITTLVSYHRRIRCLGCE